MPLDDHLVQIARRADEDSYIATLYASEPKRPALLALHAFRLETAAIRDRVREPLAGELRLQWWRDVIGGSGGGAGSPVAEALIAAVEEHRLPRQPLLDLLDARIFDLFDDPMPSRADLEGYCGETVSAPIQLACVVLDPAAAPGAAEAAGHAGCARGVADLLRALPRHRARGQCYVPADILAAAGTDASSFVAGENRPAAARAIAAMVALGREHAAAFEREAARLPPTLRPAFLPAALSTTWLDRVTRRGFDALNEVATLSPVRRHWTLLFRAARGWG